MKHINRIRNRLEYGEKVLYFIYVFLFFCFLSLDAENKKYATDLRVLIFITTFAQSMNCLTK